jgi:hypothetical protein
MSKAKSITSLKDEVIELDDKAESKKSIQSKAKTIRSMKKITDTTEIETSA